LDFDWQIKVEATRHLKKIYDCADGKKDNKIDDKMLSVNNNYFEQYYNDCLIFR